MSPIKEARDYGKQAVLEGVQGVSDGLKALKHLGLAGMEAAKPLATAALEKVAVAMDKAIEAGKPGTAKALSAVATSAGKISLYLAKAAKEMEGAEAEEPGDAE